MKELYQKISDLIAKLSSVRNSIAADGKKFTITDAWNLFQTGLAEIITAIEATLTDTSGADKKAIALQYAEQFYDKVIVNIDIPYVPNLVEPIVDKLLKQLFMYLANGAIDAIVTLLNKLGVFKG